MESEEVKRIHQVEKRMLTLQESKKALEENIKRDWNTGEIKNDKRKCN